MLSIPAAAKTSHVAHTHHARVKQARAAHALHGGNCVAYVREVTGMQVRGDAGTWWHHAEGRYQRGQQPKLGAVLVFKPHGIMRLGHVAVVSHVVNHREILVDHANWVRGRITKAMPVIDTSPHNDWSTVQVMRGNETPGRQNPTFGFIYPERAIHPERSGPNTDMLVATELGVTHMAQIVRVALDHPLPHTHRHGHHHPPQLVQHHPHHHGADRMALLSGPI